MENAMFRPMFVYNAFNTDARLCSYLRAKGYHMVNVRDEKATVKNGGNPALVIYDIFGQRSMHGNDADWDQRFAPPKRTAVMILFGENKGHIRGLPNPVAALREITGREVSSYSALTCNFRLGAPITPYELSKS